MSDDIVTRLREKANQVRVVVGVNASVTIPMLELEAADEIERQRTSIDYWFERCMRAEECVRFLEQKKWRRK